MGITDELAKLAPVAEAPNEKSSWVKDLIAQRYQPKTERLKRSPVGFDFTREPFDPSSYYKALGIYKDISRAATAVTQQESMNHEAKQRQAEYDANQASIKNALGGVNPNFTYSNTKYNGSSRHYGLKGISPTASRAADFFGSKYGIKSIGGVGPGSVPGSDHPKGRALDFMINNVSNGKSRGTALANEVIRNYKKFNVKYVIWYHYIWQPGRGWHRYNGPSPHTDHVHVSFNR